MHKDPKNAFEWFQNAIAQKNLLKIELMNECFARALELSINGDESLNVVDLRTYNKETIGLIKLAEIYLEKSAIKYEAKEKEDSSFLSQKSIECYELLKGTEIYEKNKNNLAFAYYVKARSLRETNLDEAIRFIKKATEIDKDYNDAYVLHVQMNIEKCLKLSEKNKAKAIEFFMQLEKWVQKKIGTKTSTDQKMTDEARDLLFKDSLFDIYFHQGLWHQETDKKNSIEYYKKALDIKTDPNAYLVLSNIYLVYCSELHETEQLVEETETLKDYIRYFDRPDLIKSNFESDDFSSLSKLYFNLGISYDRIGEPERAIQEYNKAVECLNNLTKSDGELTDILSDLWPIYDNLAFCFNALNQPGEAIKQYEKSIATINKLVLKGVKIDNISISKIYNSIGLSYNQLNLLDKALESFKNSIKYDESSVEIHKNIICIFKKLSMHIDCLEYVDKLIKLDPENGDGYILNELIPALFKLERYNEVLFQANELLDKNPKNYGAVLKKAITLCLLSKYKEAETFLEKITGLKELEVSDFYFIQSIIAFQCRKHAEAKNFIDRAIELESNNANFYNSKGLICLPLKLWEESIEASDEAIRIAGSFNKAELFKAYSNIGTAHTGLGEYDKAIESYNKALEIDKNDWTLNINLSLVLYYKGRYKEALECYEVSETDSDHDKAEPSSKVIVPITKEIPLSKASEIDVGPSLPKESESLIPREPGEEKAEALQYKKPEPKKPEYTKEELEDLSKKIVQFFNSHDESEKMECNNYVSNLIGSRPYLIEILNKIFKIKPESQEQSTLESLFLRPEYILFNIEQNWKLKNGFYNSYWGKFKSKMELMVQTAITGNIELSNKLEGLHQIQTELSFFRKLYFKISSKIINSLEKIGFSHGQEEKLKKSINNLTILKTDSEGKIGIKLHNIKGEKYPVPKIVGFGMDNELYASKITISTNKDILYVFDSYDDHSEMKKIINGVKKVEFDIKEDINPNIFTELLIGCSNNYESEL